MRRLTGSGFVLCSCQQPESGTALGVHALDPRSETRKKNRTARERGREGAREGRRDGRPGRLTVQVQQHNAFIVFVKISFDSALNTSDVPPDHRNRGTPSARLVDADSCGKARTFSPGTGAVACRIKLDRVPERDLVRRESVCRTRASCQPRLHRMSSCKRACHGAKACSCDSPSQTSWLGNCERNERAGGRRQ